MRYAQWVDMVERYGERELKLLTDRDNTGEINTRVLTRALDDATAFVDGYVGKLYALPLLGCAKPATTPGAPPVRVCPPVLTRIVCDVARYYLYIDLPDDHEVARRHQQVIKELKSYADGTTQLVCPWGGAPGVALNADPLEDSGAVHSFAPRQISDDTLRGFA